MPNKKDNIENVIKDTFKQIKEIVDANIVIGKNGKERCSTIYDVHCNTYD
jgi:uncharacterized spore protein YtfJ